jgi:hypothetical protein
MARQGEDYAPTGQEDYRAGRKFSSDIEDDNRPTELTENGARWQGWGTALKPSHEDIVWAVKPKAPPYETLDRINNKINLCKKDVKTAGHHSMSTQARLNVEKEDSAHVNAETPAEGCQKRETLTGQGEDTNSKMDTLESQLGEENIALSTLLSWRSILVDALEGGRMSTTLTELETIIDWKTLNFCLSQITPDDMLGVLTNQNGLNQSALVAVEYSNAALSKLKATLMLVAAGNATSKLAGRYQDTDERKISPSHEPVCVARKPLIGTVAENVLQHGTGAINVDGCRVETGETITTHKKTSEAAKGSGKFGEYGGVETHQTEGQKLGRWPANLIHDGSEEVLAGFPETGASKVQVRNQQPREAKSKGAEKARTGFMGHNDNGGSAARFFYCAKSSKKDRNSGGVQSNHPTVKPTSLMRYLCRLVTPPNGTVLDPFTGSGSTGKAAILEGFNFIGCELSPEYAAIAEARIEHAKKEKEENTKKPTQYELPL